jgi:hypothetical protein
MSALRLHLPPTPSQVAVSQGLIAGVSCSRWTRLYAVGTPASPGLKARPRSARIASSRAIALHASRAPPHPLRPPGSAPAAAAAIIAVAAGGIIITPIATTSSSSTNATTIAMAISIGIASIMAIAIVVIEAQAPSALLREESAGSLSKT